MERVTRLELATSSLARRCSTTELHPQPPGRRRIMSSGLERASAYSAAYLWHYSEERAILRNDWLGYFVGRDLERQIIQIAEVDRVRDPVVLEVKCNPARLQFFFRLVVFTAASTKGEMQHRSGG